MPARSDSRASREPLPAPEPPWRPEPAPVPSPPEPGRPTPPAAPAPPNPLVGYVPHVAVPVAPVDCTAHHLVEPLAEDLEGQLDRARARGYRLVTAVPRSEGAVLVFVHADHD